MSVPQPIFISMQECEKLLEPKELLPVIERALGNYSKGTDGGIVQPVRMMVPVEQHNGLLGVMPGLSTNDEALACKLVSVYPENWSKGIPSHLATILLFSPSDGTLQAVMDGEHITTVRTAVASAVATKHLAKADSKVLALVGSGTQARSHYDVLSLLYNFDEVRVWSRTTTNAEKLAAAIGGKAFSSVEKTVENADIICTTTFCDTPVLKGAWVKPGAHVNGVGACRATQQELDSDLMNSAVVYVDSRASATKESGDVLLSKAQIYAEIGDVINGNKKAFPEKTTVYKSLGIAVEDVVAAKVVYDKYCKAKKDSG